MNAKAQTAGSHTGETVSDSPMGGNDDKVYLHERVASLERCVADQAAKIVNLEKGAAEQEDKIVSLETSHALLSHDVSHQGDKIARLEARMENVLKQTATTQDVSDIRREMSSGFSHIRREMSSGVSHVRREMSSGFSDIRGEVSTRVSCLRKERR